MFGTGVSVAIDPRSLGTQIDDSIMQKNLSARILLIDKNYFLSVKSKVLDGRIFLTGKVDDPEEKLKLTSGNEESFTNQKGIHGDLPCSFSRSKILLAICFNYHDVDTKFKRNLS